MGLSKGRTGGLFWYVGCEAEEFLRILEPDGQEYNKG
jgi:hypothetical protein